MAQTEITQSHHADSSSFEELIDKLIQQEFYNFLKRRLLFWCLRWLAIFAALRLILVSYSGLTWVWWVAGVSALLSLMRTLISNIRLIKKEKKAIRLTPQSEHISQNQSTSMQMDSLKCK